MNVFKPMFYGFIFLSALAAYGQTRDSISVLTYAGKTFDIPSGCTALSESELKCDGFVVQWLYMNDMMLETMPAQFMKQLEDKLKKFKKKPAICTSLDSRMECYKVSYKNKGDTHYKIIASGRVNQRPVMLNLTLMNNPVNNEALPPFVREFIELSN